LLAQLSTTYCAANIFAFNTILFVATVSTISIRPGISCTYLGAFARFHAMNFGGNG